MIVWQSRLVGIDLSGPRESVRCKNLFPFFTPTCAVMFVMVEDATGKLRYFSQATMRALVKTVLAEDLREIGDEDILSNDLFKAKYHFDPAWIVKGDGTLPAKLRATNLAARPTLADVGFDEALAQATHFRMKNDSVVKVEDLK